MTTEQPTENLSDFLRRHSVEDQSRDVFIVNVSPELAEFLLRFNFSNNRKPSKAYIKKLATEMKEGRWTLSADALAISDTGQLGNGQHRLNAIVQSGTTQPFVVIGNIPESTFQKFDTGKTRTMDQRITIAGESVTAKECSVIRHAMNAYTFPQLGTVEFGYSKYDELVKENYLKHKEFLSWFAKVKGGSGPSVIYAAALKIFAEMVWYREDVFSHCKHTLASNQGALVRAQLFVDIMIDGYSKQGYSVGEEERAAILLRNKAQDHRHGSFWSEKQSWRLAMSSAYKFMQGYPSEILRTSAADPFHSFVQMPSTNDYFLKPSHPPDSNPDWNLPN